MICCFRMLAKKPKWHTEGKRAMGEAKILLRDTAAAAAVVEVERKLTVPELLWNDGFVRKTLIILFLAAAWEAYGTYLDNPLLFPTFHDTIITMFDKVRDGTIPLRAWASLKVLFMGYSAGIVLAAIFTILAISTRIGTDFLETVTAMFNPLPAIALLPLALIWFGLGNGSLVFVLIHSVLWPVALNTHSGFKSVSNTLRMVGRNYGLRGLPYVARILIPAAFGSILTGLKIGWAFAWRTLIAAELVFGVSSGQGGLGWFIFENRNLLDIPAVFAGLLTVIIIGLIVENLIFRTIERNTVQKWGTQS
jgi:sulfonate transport system permease protein